MGLSFNFKICPIRTCWGDRTQLKLFLFPKPTFLPLAYRTSWSVRIKTVWQDCCWRAVLMHQSTVDIGFSSPWQQPFPNSSTSTLNLTYLSLGTHTTMTSVTINVWVDEWLKRSHIPSLAYFVWAEYLQGDQMRRLHSDFIYFSVMVSPLQAKVKTRGSFFSSGRRDGSASEGKLGSFQSMKSPCALKKTQRQNKVVLRPFVIIFFYRQISCSL